MNHDGYTFDLGRFYFSVILSNIDESVIISLEKGHHESLIFYYDL